MVSPINNTQILLLATAKILLIAENGNKLIAGALINYFISQTNFINTKTVQKLGNFT